MPGPLQAVLWGGGGCAILDGIAATTQFTLSGAKPARIWQSVASAVLGESAFRQGGVAVAVGLSLHCLVAFTVATIFVAFSLWLPFLAEASWLTGPIYGVLVFLVMNLIVVPLSRRAKTSRPTSAMIIQIFIHILFVGLPISMATHRFVQGAH